ncbi:MAG: nuclease-related domain-containing protein [Rhodoglobus sp.]|nr:nuclease-related domain-containing protein [Rhodoglobus sp.]
MDDLRTRVPGHSLIDELLRHWDLGAIRVDPQTNDVIIDENAQRCYRDIIGKRTVGALLAQLDEGWTVLHSVPVGHGKSDIDHVVIGAPGVFTMAIKFNPGDDVWVSGRSISVGGTQQQHVADTLHEARRATSYLSLHSGLTVPVVGAIVFVDPERINLRSPVAGGDNDPEIRVLAQTDLIDSIHGRAVLSQEQVLRIASAAVQPGTWHEAPQLSSAGSHIAREFEALERALRSQSETALAQAEWAQAAPAR